MTEIEWLEMFGHRLNECLRKAKMTQQELAEATGLSKSTISRYVSGMQMPFAKALINICWELEIDISDLIDFGEPIED